MERARRKRGRGMAAQHMAVQLGTWILVACLVVPVEVAEMGDDADQCSAITNPLSGVVEQSDLEERGVIVRLCGFELTSPGPHDMISCSALRTYAGETVHCYFRSNSEVQEYRAFTWPAEEDHVMKFRAPTKGFGDWENTPRLNLSIFATAPQDWTLAIESHALGVAI
ncbi:hypothetical protein T484DRAFT_1913356 [Baffinella frigidus]|nr:hypothetical protein T484DRAFT_1913356 [Cryptophyta sp. CCMP2293]